MRKPDSVEMKECSFCGEIIKMEAIKCRFCAEYLTCDENVDSTADNVLRQQRTEELDEGILYFGSPSILSLLRAFLKFLIIVSVAVALLIFKLEVYLEAFLGEHGGLSSDSYFTLGLCRQGAAIVMLTAAVVWLLIKVAILKSTYYEVTEDRIEWARGIIHRKVDNIDMFRIMDLSLNRTFLDCIFGIGTVNVVTSDKTDPNFAFTKVPDARYLYDALKRASATADRRRGVVHLE